eukprot:scaffold13879_cov61-Phaeocystis_antarctica.AAC.8
MAAFAHASSERNLSERSSLNSICPSCVCVIGPFLSRPLNTSYNAPLSPGARACMARARRVSSRAVCCV